MTKEQAIAKTEYTESELMTLALHIAKAWAKDKRDNAEDDEGWDHYYDLTEAFGAMVEERMAAEKAANA